VVARVGFEGDYLHQKETSRRLRAGEVFMPEVAARLSWEAWASSGSDEVALARERATQSVAAAEERGPILGVRTLSLARIPPWIILRSCASTRSR